MFRASSAHLQEDTVVHVQHMVLSLSMGVRGGLSVHSLSENSRGCNNTICPPEDEQGTARNMLRIIM
jgi:hypothetical protein